MDRASDVARRLVEQGVSSRAATGCAHRRRGVWHREFGGDTSLFFDLASVTKPLTAVAVAAIGPLRTQPLSVSLSEARGTASEHTPIELLLAHRAGLEANLPLYLPAASGAELDRSLALESAANARRVECVGAVPPLGFVPVYSDLGYVLVGAALARHVGEVDSGAVVDALLVPRLECQSILGTRRALLVRGVDLDSRVAPTEDVVWRNGVVSGWVHDENAFALTGEGGSGHAGHFGTVDAVVAFGIAVLDALRGRANSALAGVDVGWLVEARPDGTLRAGFDGKSDEGSSAGDAFGERSFGHLGFTGTSLWIDPDADVVVAMLTNRVHPTRDNVRIRTARPLAHSALHERARSL